MYNIDLLTFVKKPKIVCVCACWKGGTNPIRYFLSGTYGTWGGTPNALSLGSLESLGYVTTTSWSGNANAVSRERSLRSSSGSGPEPILNPTIQVSTQKFREAEIPSQSPTVRPQIPAGWFLTGPNPGRLMCILAKESIPEYLWSSYMNAVKKSSFLVFHRNFWVTAISWKSSLRFWNQF